MSSTAASWCLCHHKVLPCACRRLEKRIMVPLPTAEGRAAMLQSLVGERAEQGLDLSAVVGRTEGFSGSDMHLLAKEAAMRPLR